MKYFTGNTYITFICKEGLFRAIIYLDKPESIESLQAKIDLKGFKIFFRFTNTKVLELQKFTWFNKLRYGKSVLYCIQSFYKKDV